MLAAIIPRSPTSGRMRYVPTVGGEKLSQTDATHHRIPNESMVKMQGRIAYALHMDEHAKKWELSRKNESMLATIIPCSPTSGCMQYTPTIGGKNFHKPMPAITASPTNK